MFRHENSCAILREIGKCQCGGGRGAGGGVPSSTGETLGSDEKRLNHPWHHLPLPQLMVEPSASATPIADFRPHS